jgi:hypothetical protein
MQHRTSVNAFLTLKAGAGEALISANSSMKSADENA